MGAPQPRMRARAQGFSLVEALVAIALLASVMAAVSTSQGDSIYRGIEVMNLTSATELIETVVLDIEEEYRTDGFPTNQLENKACDEFLPKGYDSFKCEYDLLELDVNNENMSALGAEANEKISGSSLMNTFCGQDGGAAAANIAAVCTQLQAAKGMGLPTELSAFAPLCDPGLSQLCGVNLDKMCQNTQLITSFIPTIIEQAAKSTRKLVVRLTWQDEGLVANDLEIETFITAVPDAERTQ